MFLLIGLDKQQRAALEKRMEEEDYFEMWADVLGTSTEWVAEHSPALNAALEAPLLLNKQDAFQIIIDDTNRKGSPIVPETGVLYSLGK